MTKTQALTDIVLTITETIRQLGTVPEGHLYARVMSYMSLETFNGVLGIIERAGLISRRAHLITWTGPDFAPVADLPQTTKRDAALDRWSKSR